jgi:hypothetical protein
MDNQIIDVQAQQRPLSVKDVVWQVEQIQEIMKSVMKPNIDYGIIPGCKLPTLLKPGSEILLTTFHIASKPEVTDLSTSDKVHYRVISYGYYKDGTFIGTGVGECSSNEEKYKWRKAINDSEFNETTADRRREKWCKGKFGKPDFKVKQIRTELADLANTVLKMAKKRSQVDLTLTCTGASRLFTQDIEDMPEEIINNEEHHEQGGNQQPKTGVSTISEKQIGRYKAIMANAQKTGVTTEIAKVIITNVKPDAKFNDKSQFTWEGATQGQYKEICDLFESGNWRARYAEISAIEDIAQNLDDVK